jgi:hypothetical protein
MGPSKSAPHHRPDIITFYRIAQRQAPCICDGGHRRSASYGRTCWLHLATRSSFCACLSQSKIKTGLRSRSRVDQTTLQNANVLLAGAVQRCAHHQHTIEDSDYMWAHVSAPSSSTMTPLRSPEPLKDQDRAPVPLWVGSDITKQINVLLEGAVQRCAHHQHTTTGMTIYVGARAGSIKQHDAPLALA